MKNVQDEARFFHDLFDMLEAHMGKSVEITLLDNSSGKPVIQDIRAGHITGRHAGDHANADEFLSLYVNAETLGSDRRFAHTKSGRILRYSGMPVFDQDKNTVGYLEINQDITRAVEVEQFLRDYNMYRICDAGICTTNISSVLDDLIQEALISIGKPVAEMTRDDKLNFIRILHKQGAFMITKAGTKVCSLLDISKYTFYSYIKMIVQGTEEE